ncbi:alpha/beta fold hydrolase [Hoyosella rhizosphaerae]|nr:alpha/beta fold hydrolase [Hoyosella rhizosphaerae]MBN4927330.1 alpha/beta fold hydrolase [Hoyosella rhizosphaerae]
MDTPTKYVTNGDIRIAVFESGNPSGTPLVLVHGWPDTHALWDAVVAELGDTFRIISYDTRGAGLTTAPNSTSAYALPELARDFYAVIDDVCPDGQVHVLAHDWGGVETWEVLGEPQAEQRIASATITSGPNLDILGSWVRDRFSRPTPRNLAGPLRQLANSWYTYLFHIPMLPQYVLRNGVAQHWPRFLALFDGQDAERVRPAATLPDDMANGVNRYRANIGPRLSRPRSKIINVPVQVIINMRDPAVHHSGYADYGKYVTHMVERKIDAGHWAPISHPAILAAATREFIDTVTQKTGE